MTERCELRVLTDNIRDWLQCWHSWCPSSVRVRRGRMTDTSILLLAGLLPVLRLVFRLLVLRLVLVVRFRLGAGQGLSKRLGHLLELLVHRQADQFPRQASGRLLHVSLVLLLEGF